MKWETAVFFVIEDSDPGRPDWSPRHLLVISKGPVAAGAAMGRHPIKMPPPKNAQKY